MLETIGRRVSRFVWDYSRLFVCGVLELRWVVDGGLKETVCLLERSPYVCGGLGADAL